MSTSLADRDCSRPTKSVFSRSNTLASQSSGSRSLPRRRSINSVNPKASFQPSHSMQNPQYARKAAQAMLERRRASAVSQAPNMSLENAVVSSSTTEQPFQAPELTQSHSSVLNSSDDHFDSNNPPAPLREKGQVPRELGNYNKTKPTVINVTVDEGGVHILDSKPKNTGRNSSRNKIGRASSRTRQDIRQRLQNSWVEDKENGGAPNTSLEATFPVRRQSIRDWKSAFDATSGPVSPSATGNTLTRSSEWDGSMPRRHSSRSFIHRRNGAGDSLANAPTNAPTESHPTKLRSERETDGVTNVDLEQTKNDDDEHGDSDTCAEDREVSIENSTLDENTMPLTTVSVDKNGETKMPDHGRWCDSCAGVGLIVAALLADREKREAGTEQGNDDGSPKKGGWRSVVLGDSGRTKLEKENARLVKENKALFDVIHQLQRRLNDSRKE